MEQYEEEEGDGECDARSRPLVQRSVEDDASATDCLGLVAQPLKAKHDQAVRVVHCKKFAFWGRESQGVFENDYKCARDNIQVSGAF